MKLGELYKKLKLDFSESGQDAPPDMLARAVLEHTCAINAATLIAQPDLEISFDQIHAANNMAARLCAGVPLSRILGWREFYGLRFDLGAETLDPRPDTEILVETALKWLAKTPLATRMLDLGTGTGCIPVSILANCPRMTGVAVDIAAGAAEMAVANATRNGVVDRLTVYVGDWLAPVPVGDRFDLITSNPPYIPAAEIANLDDSVRLYDPIRALDGGADGYDPYRHLFIAIKRVLKPGGLALFEIGAGQLADLRRIAVNSGLDVETVVMDYAGTPRVMGVCVRP